MDKISITVTEESIVENYKKWGFKTLLDCLKRDGYKCPAGPLENNLVFKALECLAEEQETKTK